MKQVSVIDLYEATPVAILGASGFIGRWLARSLSARRARLYLFVRNATAAEAVLAGCEARGEIIEVDLTETGRFASAFQRIRPAITFNAAGYGVDPVEQDDEAAYEINFEFVKTLCAILPGIRCPSWQGQDLVHAGSALEYGSIGGTLSEDRQPNPTSAYGRSKLAATLHLANRCREDGIRCVTARLFTVYGPGEHQGRLLPSLLKAARTRELLKLTSGGQKRDFTYVGDVAEGLLRLGLSAAPPGAVVNLATGRLTSVRDFADTAARVLGIPPDCLDYGALPTRREEIVHEDVSVERLKALAGWIPETDVEDGIRRTWEFDRQIVKSPDREIAESPDREITKSPDHQITKSPDHQITKSPDR